VKFVAPGYSSQWYNNKSSASDADPVTVNAGNPTLHINANLVPYQKLIGANDATAAGSQAGNLLALDKWVAGSTGSVCQVRVKSGAGSNIKVAIYADNAGEPGTLLNANNAGTAVTAGIWNTISIPSTPVVAGTTYWLGFISEGTCTGYVATGGTMRYKTNVTYASYSFPNPAGAEFTQLTGYYHQLAGWGTPPPVPPATTFITPGTAITFKWSAADSADNYHLQVNTLSDFNGTDVFNAEVGNVTVREVTGLTPGITYYWRVKAGNIAGWSDWSTTASVLSSMVP
jgi:hypothetical protein